LLWTRVFFIPAKKNKVFIREYRGPFQALPHSSVGNHVMNMATEGRNRGNIRRHPYVSMGAPPPKKRYVTGTPPAREALERDVEYSPRSGSSTVTSNSESSGGSLRSEEDGSRRSGGGLGNGGSDTGTEDADKENMREMFESWYRTRCRTTLPVLGTPEIITQSSVVNGPGVKGTWKQVWKAKCEARLPFLYDVCTPGLIESCFLRPVMKVGWLQGDANTTITESIKYASGWMSGLKFAKAPRMGKNAWSTEGGKLQMFFRECVVREAIRRIEADAGTIMEEIRKKKGITEDDEGEIPEWMTPGFIKSVHVQAVLKGKVGTGSSQGRRLRTKKVEAADAAMHVVKVLYEQVSKTHTAARRRIDDAYYGKTGHLHVDWSKYPVVGSGQQTYVSQANVVFHFPKEADGIMQLKLNTLPVASFMDGEKTVGTIDKENRAKYRILEAQLEELYVVVSHEGLDKEDGQWVKKRGDKTVKFLPLAVQMLLTFSFGVNKERLFRSDPSSFKRITGLACLLYALTLEYDEVRKEKKVDVLSNLDEICIGALRLSQLMPCEYRIREVIRKGGCLTW